jgi:hypothetical protein
MRGYRDGGATMFTLKGASRAGATVLLMLAGIAAVMAFARMLAVWLVSLCELIFT